MKVKQKVFFYDKEILTWRVRTDEITLLKALSQEIQAYRQVIIPYYWNRLVDKINNG